MSDAEKSRGLGLRASRSLLRAGCGWKAASRASRFESPPDPTLEQGEKVVAIAPTTRSASFATAAVDVVKGAGLRCDRHARHERVDPAVPERGGLD